MPITPPNGQRQKEPEAVTTGEEPRAKAAGGATLRTFLALGQQLSMVKARRLRQRRLQTLMRHKAGQQQPLRRVLVDKTNTATGNPVGLGGESDLSKGLKGSGTMELGRQHRAVGEPRTVDFENSMPLVERVEDLQVWFDDARDYLRSLSSTLAGRFEFILRISSELE